MMSVYGVGAGRTMAFLLTVVALSTFQSLQPLERYVMVERMATAKTATFSSEHFTDTIEIINALPTCLSLMSENGSDFASGDFITDSSTKRTWAMRADGSRQLDLDEICTLHRYSAIEARQCLANKHILLVGDSLTRFQTTSLIHFLHKGRFPPRFERPPVNEPCEHDTEEMISQNLTVCSPHEEPNVCTEDDYVRTPFQDRWKSYHHQVGGALDGGVFDGRMECDCARGNEVKCPPGVLGCEAENFLYRSKPDGTVDQRTTVSFFFEAGWGDDPRPIRGLGFTDCAEKGTCRRDVNITKDKVARVSSLDYEWYQPLEDALQKNGTFQTHLPKVDYAVYNRGLWGTITQERAQRVMPLFKELTRANGQSRDGRCFFKSTTGSPRTSPMSIEREEGVIHNETEKAGCSFLGFSQLTREFGKMSRNATLCPERKSIFVDEVHFRPWVYEELNNLFLNVLCNQDLGAFDKREQATHNHLLENAFQLLRVGRMGMTLDTR